MPLYNPSSDSATLALETPTGDVNGVNAEFVFTSPPIFVTHQGVIQRSGTDYAIISTTVTFTIPPVSGVVQGFVSS